MQDITKHTTPHTDSNCRPCQLVSPAQRLAISERKTLRLMDNVLDRFLTHRHTFGVRVDQDTEDDKGRALEGGSYETCSYPTCAVIREFV